MASQCLTEESLLALLAGDASAEGWREHLEIGRAHV